MKKVTFTVVPHLPHLQIGVKLIGVGENYNLNFHDHPYNEVAVVLSAGKDCRHCANGQSVPISRGDVLLIRPGQAHAYENTREFSVLNFLYDAINLPLPQLDGAALPLYQELCSPKEKRDNTVLPIVKMNENELDELQELTKPLIRELENLRPAANLCVFGLFISALVIICRSGKSYPEKIQEFSALPALNYINLHFKEKITLDKLVAITRLSRNTLYRKFNELTGSSPINYQLNKKLDAARELLQNSNLTIGEIAFQCGFCDSNHLIKLFSAKFGISPGKLRKTHK